MGYEEFIASLDPKIAKAIKSAENTSVTRLPLASYGLTKALNGGIAKGRITLLYGNTSSGKSLMMLQTIGIWQKMGLVCAYVDVEGTFDKSFARRLGVNTEELILIQSKSSGRIEKEIAPLIEKKIDAIVIDSISDIMPEVFVNKDGELNDQTDRKQVGAHAKAITSLVNGIHYMNDVEDGAAVVLISQTTTFFGQSYVEQVPHGGQKVQFASSQIIKLTSSASESKQITGDKYVGDMIFQEPIGRPVDALVKKNKLGPQSTTAKYDIYYAGSNLGVDIVNEVVKAAIKYDVIRKSGAWFNYGDNKWQGETAVTNFFKDDPEELELLKKAIHTAETGELV